MAKDKNTEDLDIVMDGMPGADQKTTEDVEPFQVDLNFGDETPTEDAEESEEEEVEFPTEEEVVEVEEETADEEEQDSEDEVTAEEETPDAEQEAAEEIVDELVETEEEPEKPVEPPKSPMVPKSRLDEVLAKNKKMQKQLDDIQQKEAEVQAEAPQYDFDGKEVEYQQLILDGDSTSAVALRTEMRAAEKEQVMFEMQQQMGQTVQQSQAAQDLQEKAKEIEATFSILNENHEDFDKEITTEVMELRDAFIVQGYEPADSLAKATEYTLAVKRPELLNGVEDSTTKQNKAVVQNRQRTAVKKKLEASKSQPPKLQGEGTAKRGDKVADLNILSDEEFGALPEETLKRMRGDFG